ncbi:hypothetical protein EV207_13839 [Scopulibacillus darangshiensis]|uniref:Uncharacterized protein n=1 Tax=Scopulibacillus darangshiensis TaxID=442528 RepID=A0A4R2NKP6_9BACL|nr:hypothetical protein [Scopulibacillus darangshiensis]TCP21952.1 hypothetical protein EV207_13839 [Scopulibacillus darangshiensis]
MEDQQQLKELKDKLDHLDKMMKAMKGQGMSYYVNIEHADIHGPVVDQLDYNFDNVDVKEVSGALNLGNNFGVRVSGVKKKKAGGHNKPQDASSQGEPSHSSTDREEKSSPQKKQHSPSGHPQSQQTQNRGKSPSSGQEAAKHTTLQARPPVSKNPAQPGQTSHKDGLTKPSGEMRDKENEKKKEVHSQVQTKANPKSVANKRKERAIGDNKKVNTPNLTSEKSETKKEKKMSLPAHSDPNRHSAPPKVSFQRRFPNQAEEKDTEKRPVRTEKSSLRTKEVPNMARENEQEPPPADHHSKEGAIKKGFEKFAQRLKLSKNASESDTYSKNDETDSYHTTEKEEKTITRKDEENNPQLIENDKLPADPKNSIKEEGQKTSPPKRLSQTKKGFSFKMDHKE